MFPTGPRPKIAVLALALTLVLAGCTGGSQIGNQPPSTMTTTSTPTSGTPVAKSSTTSSPNPTSTTPASNKLQTKSYPDHPTNLTTESAARFATQYETAYKWNHELTADTTNMSITPEHSNTSKAGDDGYVVHLEVGFSKTITQNGTKATGDGYYTVNYYINDSTVMRAETAGQARPGPDPRNGTIVSTNSENP